MDIFQQWWNSLSEGARDNIVGGLIVAAIVAAVGLAWRAIARRVWPPKLPEAAAPPSPAEAAAALSRAELAERRDLQRVIEDRFSPEELIAELCAPLGIRPENALTGDTHAMRVSSLVGYCVRTGRLADLRQAVNDARPGALAPPVTPFAARPPAPRARYLLRGPEQQVEAKLRSPDGIAAIIGLTAPGGIGKSEMAAHVARKLVAEGAFAQAIWLDCGAKPAEQVAGDLSLALGIPPDPRAESLEARLGALDALLNGRRALIVLDDVRPPNLDFVRRFEPPPGCAVLITSRIEQPGERIPLDHIIPVKPLDDAQARQLLADRLGAAMLDAEPEATARLIARCKGNALALDIAAARILSARDMAHPVAWFEARARANLRELRVVNAERRDLFAVFGASVEALDEADRRRFRRMAVFPATGGTPAHIAAVWGDDPATADDAIQRLKGLSLLKTVEQADDRYRLHDLQDEYALDGLRRAGDEEAARIAHAEWLIALFERHELSDLSTAPHAGQEFDNLVAAANWAVEAGQGELLARLATTPRNWLHNIFRNTAQWQGWLERALVLGVAQPELKANVLKAIGDVQQFRDDRDAALANYNQALALFRQIGDRLGEANVLKAIGDVQQFRMETDAALASYHQALALFRQIGDRLGEASVYLAIGRLRGEPELFERGIALYRQIGDAYSTARGQYFLALLLLVQGKIDQAILCLCEARQIWAQMGFEQGVQAVDQALARAASPPPDPSQGKE